jgi:dTDP-4-amino-4,6-dideoxygalactose transaminase
LHYIPVHRHPYYENLGFKKNDFPTAEKFHKETISIPMYPTLSDEDLEKVIEVLKNI